MKPRAALDLSTRHALLAGRFAAFRDYWLNQARHSRDKDLGMTQVAFARSAHHAYLRALQRVIKKQAPTPRRPFLRIVK